MKLSKQKHKKQNHKKNKQGTSGSDDPEAKQTDPERPGRETRCFDRKPKDLQLSSSSQAVQLSLSSSLSSLFSLRLDH